MWVRNLILLAQMLLSECGLKKERHMSDKSLKYVDGQQVEIFSRSLQGSCSLADCALPGGGNN
jgi:hypothetical protein